MSLYFVWVNNQEEMYQTVVGRKSINELEQCKQEYIYNVTIEYYDAIDMTQILRKTFDNLPVHNKGKSETEGNDEYCRNGN